MENTAPLVPQNSFVKTLSELRKGKVLDELSTGLAEAVGAVRKTGRKGQVSLKLTLIPSADGETIQIDDDLSVKTPKMPTKPTMFFTTEDNQLTRDNPNQREFELGVVDGSREEERAVASK